MVDLLVIAPHPDDAEIHCGGTIAAHVRQGATVVVADATRGELASRGTPDERAAEAAEAARILGLTGRESLGLTDGRLADAGTAGRDVVVDCLRRHRPKTVLCLDRRARHPDHVALADLVRVAMKTAELHGLRTGAPAIPHRSARLWFAEAELRLEPDLLVPLTVEDWARKMAAIRCYGSQLHRAGAQAPDTSISRSAFLAWIEERGRAWGREAEAPFAEAFVRGDDWPRIEDLRRI